MPPGPVTPATAGPNLPPIANDAIVDQRGFLTPLGLNLFQMMWAGIYGTNSIIDRVAQPGWIQPIGGATVTSGWLLCDNAAYSRTGTYAALFAAIGSAWGAAPAGMFRVPGLKGNFAYGADGTHALGTMGGALSRVIAKANLPSYALTVTDPGHVHGITDPGHDHTKGATPSSTNTAGAAPGTMTGSNTGTAVTGISVDSAVTGITVDSGGSGTPLDTTPTFAAVNWMIKF